MSQRTTTIERLRGSVAGYGLPVRTVVALVAALLGNIAIVNIAISTDLAPELLALSYPPVAFLTTVGVLGAAVVYWLLSTRVDSPTRTFTRLAWAVLVLSFVPDIGILLVDETATAAGVGALALMHLTAAVACIAFIPAAE